VTIFKTYAVIQKLLIKSNPPAPKPPEGEKQISVTQPLTSNLSPDRKLFKNNSRHSASVTDDINA
jgi:hypothetical protein